MDQPAAILASAIGVRVKRERNARGWTLDQLAEAAGVSRRAVVNVEQGSANPSVGTLLRISDALGVGLPALVEPPESTQLQVTRSGAGAVLWRSDAGGRGVLVAGTQPPDVVELWDWTLHPGDRHHSEAHTAGTKELLQVRDGTVTVEYGEQPVTLAPGDALAFAGDVEHAYANHGDEPARFTLAVFEPGVGAVVRPQTMTQTMTAREAPAMTTTRPDKHDYATLTEESWAVHGGNRPDATTGAIRTPIVLANSYALPDDPATLDESDPDALVYTRESGANQLGLQTKLAALEHGEAAAVFGTGMAALHATFFTLLNPGDHAIVSNVVYMRVFGLFDSILPAKLGIDVDFVDITDLDAVRAAVRPTTRLIHTEVIANPDLRVAEIAPLAHIAHAAGALLTVDSTFTPPPIMRPLDLGADVVVHSLTKYVNGHGDAMGGVVVAARSLVDEIKFGPMHHVGGAISPFNAWLIMRGSVTLPMRLQRHCDNAHAIATFLAADPRVAHVAYPGLAGDERHDRACAQLDGRYGGIVSFAVAGEHADRLRFVNDLRVITSAVSLGHDETLVAYEQHPESRAKAFAAPFRELGLVRLAVGLESAEDLVADLDAALTSVYGRR